MAEGIRKEIEEQEARLLAVNREYGELLSQAQEKLVEHKEIANRLSVLRADEYAELTRKRVES